ncbi:MAG TPA: class I SAM-dependent methyltransferase [Nitrospirota bacterium]|nr:class I SAM-dependent methyltransferase [Nitrospirota bacterium]
MSTVLTCGICRNAKNNTSYTMREMFYGTRDGFSYFQCTSCGCLQIAEIPKDMSKYYSREYYSYSDRFQSKYRNPLRRKIRQWRNYHNIIRNTVVGALVSRIAPNKKFGSLSMIRPLSRSSRILDVGCGGGELIFMIREAGFTNTLGIDPYLPADITYENGLKIQKISVHDLQGEWDVIMYNHSFEHTPDQKEQLLSVRRLLSPGGTCLIRIPTVTSRAWEQYRENWVQLDAPRHFYLHSRKSMDLLARETGFRVEKVVYDSTNVQFYGSELYRMDLPLVHLLSNTVFSKDQMRKWEKEAETLNRQQRGDQAAFYLRKLEV